MILYWNLTSFLRNILHKCSPSFVYILALIFSTALPIKQEATWQGYVFTVFLKTEECIYLLLLFEIIILLNIFSFILSFLSHKHLPVFLKLMVLFCTSCYCIHLYVYILLNATCIKQYNTACIHIFRAGHLALNKQLVCSSLRKICLSHSQISSGAESSLSSVEASWLFSFQLAYLMVLSLLSLLGTDVLGWCYLCSFLRY